MQQQKVYIESLGCARNQVDSEVMASRLRAARLTLTQDPSEADAIVVNTCSFIESAADESIDTILALAQHKRHRCRCLVVAGCLSQRYGRETLEAMPEVDILLGTGAYDKIVEAVTEHLPQGTCLLPDPDSVDVLQPALRQTFTPHTAYLKIAEGCNRLCTYCIIPKLRGRQKSRPLKTLIAEANDLIFNGIKELTLVAQETSAYGGDLSPPVSLSILLKELAELDSTVWVRVLYGHPGSLTDDMVETVASYENLCPYFDIPIQHVSERVLHRMGRNYSTDELKRLFANLRTKLPGAALRTTLLVGFPGETDRDFQQLMDFIEQTRFDHLGVFTYSDAEDLPAHRLDHHVEPRVARERQTALMEVQQKISARQLGSRLDSEMTVLVESMAEPELYVGRSQWQAPEVDGSILIKSRRAIDPGSFVRVRITDTLEYDLMGEPL
jgi:ribosomal protein S12 methylthiotransferase